MVPHQWGTFGGGIQIQADTATSSCECAGANVGCNWHCEPCTPQATTWELRGRLKTYWIPYGFVLRANVAAQVAPAPATLKIHSA